jgi:hypothetical protein
MPEIIGKWNLVPDNFEQGKFPKENAGIHSSRHPLLEYGFDKAQWSLNVFQKGSLDGLQVFKMNDLKSGVNTSSHGGTSSDRGMSTVLLLEDEKNCKDLEVIFFPFSPMPWPP